MRYSFFSLLLLVKIRYFRNIWLVSSPHCVAVSPNHCWICKCPHHFLGCIGASFFALTWLPGLPENPEHTSIIIRSEMIIPSKLEISLPCLTTKGYMPCFLINLPVNYGLYGLKFNRFCHIHNLPAQLFPSRPW